MAKKQQYFGNNINLPLIPQQHSETFFDIFGSRLAVLVLVGLVLAAGGILVYLLLGSQGAPQQQAESLPTPTTVAGSSDALRESGTIGEEEDGGEEVGGQQEPIAGIVTPDFVFNTDGVVKTFEEGIILIIGSGTNFGDLVPRDITLQITTGTSFVLAGSTQISKGFDGLSLVSVGDHILVESATNIRGYDTFEASYITILPE